MNDKYLPLVLGTDLLFIFIACYFIYYGIDSKQIVLSFIGGFLLIIGIIRFIIFVTNFKKHGTE